MLKNAKKNGFCPLDASLCEQISSASKSVVFITFSRCTLSHCLISFFTINVMTKMWSFWWRNLWSLLLPKICDMRWWAVFDHGEKNWKSNFVLDLILRFGQKSEPVLSHFELWKKGWSFKPATKKLNFKFLYCNNDFSFSLFLVKRKAQFANGTSFTINWTSKMPSFWWRNLWSLLLPKKCDMRMMSCIWFWPSELKKQFCSLPHSKFQIEVWFVFEAMWALKKGLKVLTRNSKVRFWIFMLLQH